MILTHDYDIIWKKYEGLFKNEQRTSSERNNEEENKSNHKWIKGLENEYLKQNIKMEINVKVK